MTERRAVQPTLAVQDAIDYAKGLRLARAPRLLVAAAVVIAAGALFLAAVLFADGKAAEHAQFHAVFGLFAGLLAAFAAALLPVPAGGRSRTARVVLVGALWLAAGAQLLEAVSTFGLEADDETTKIQALAIVHWVMPVGFMALPLGALFLLLTVLSRVAGRRKRA